MAVRGTKKCHKSDLKFKDYENCLKATQLENKISHLENNKIDIECLKEDRKELIKKQLNNIKNTAKI